jgi:hypothetical protein
MQSLSGTWTGTFSFSPANGARQDLNVPQLTMECPGSGVSSTFLSAGPYSGSFSGTLQDPSAITSTTQVMGTLTLINNLAGRNPTTCRGVGNFTGTVNWTRFVITVPQITVDCGTVYTTVTLSLVRQQ